MRGILHKLLGYQPPQAAPFHLDFSPAGGNGAGASQPGEEVPGAPSDAWNGLKPPGSSLQDNLGALESLFHAQPNQDMVTRRFSLGLSRPVMAAAVYLEGLCDKTVQDEAILIPLMVLSEGRFDEPPERLCDLVQHNLLPANQITSAKDWGSVVQGIMDGETAILVDGCADILLAETRTSWRSVESPKTEVVLRGPHEAFNETMRVNTGLIRRRLHRPDLLTEILTVGQFSPMTCALMYLKDLVNPALLQEVKHRLQGIKADYIGSSGELEQFIEDGYWFPFPDVLATERPDRVAEALSKGKVAVILEGDPYVLVVPTTLFPLLHAAEDKNVRWPYGNLLRAVRTTAAVVALFLPGLYIALTNFHQEMIPTALLFAIAGARERVPFPSAIEIFLMLAAFELILEAGVRVPSQLGVTIGIVGALILGQAAVAASIVSPITVIVVAVTALGSFAMPAGAIGYGLRLGRFAFLLLGATFGFIGIALGLIVSALMMAGHTSFGVPYLAPIAPTLASSPNALYRAPVWNMESRPAQLAPRIKKRQPKVGRTWRRRGGKS